MRTLIRIDRNGTKYWDEDECPKCAGTGYVWSTVDGGRCWKCNASGIYHRTIKEYTPEHEAKLAERRLAKYRKQAPEKNARFFERYGLDTEGTAWAVCGNTYSIKEELKAEGARFNYVYGWHFDHEVDKYVTAKVCIEQVAQQNDIGEWWLTDEASARVEALKKAATPTPESTSHHVGKIKERLTLTLTLTGVYEYETHFTYYGETNYIYTMQDADGNVFVWKTGTAIGRNNDDGEWVPMEKGDTFVLTGTVKEHSEYNGTPQTVLTRCRLAA